MENYFGKMCPFCKTEIKKDEPVKVCPACGIPHHESCWEENKGCTTFGCSEQHYEEQGSNTMTICSNCGTKLSDDQDFCPKCGTPKGKVKNNFCEKCGAELQEGQEFCAKCGQKVDLKIDAGVNSAINQFNNNVSKANKKVKRKPIIIAAVTLAVIAIVISAVLLAPSIFKSADDYMAIGDYEKAYSMVKSEDEKTEVYAENAAAVQSAFSADNLKDPSSFKLRDAYYHETTNIDGDPIERLVLFISGTNSYGANVSSYWLYTWDSDSNSWEYFCSVSDLTDEEYSIYDDDDEEPQKLINNLGRSIIESAMSDGVKLDKEAINRINTQFNNGTLDAVDLLNIDE